MSQNNLLRDQLEESHQLNEALTNDLQKLTNDWEALRDEMAIKEDEWKDEEQVQRGTTYKVTTSSLTLASPYPFLFLINIINFTDEKFMWSDNDK